LGEAHFFDEILLDFFIIRPVNFLSGDKTKKKVEKDETDSGGDK
jgi:hypothetical protein